MRILITLLSLCVSIGVSSQSLLANGSFEDINTCTEYNIECAPEAWMSSAAGFINYFKDPNRAHTGMNCMAIEAAHLKKPYSRTYIRSRLLCALRKNNEYTIEFFIKSIHPILDSVGILFFTKDPLYDKTLLLGMTPSIYLQGHVMPNQMGDSAWRKVQLRYRATGEEVYMLVGYFGKADYKGPRPEELENRYYIFLDDFSMLPADPNEHICAGWQLAKEEIYSENERHELLEKKIKYYRNSPQPQPQLERNTYTVIDTLILPDLFFETGKASLQTGSFSMLDMIALSAGDKQIDSLVLKGHTDNTGTLLSNETLSLNRAKTVADYLAPRISKMPVPVFVYGLADRQPVADNTTPAGRQRNRRVEVLLYVRE
jgi:outer membrane protein OmpA-like peptidoglycan-associated protein